MIKKIYTYQISCDCCRCVDAIVSTNDYDDTVYHDGELPSGWVQGKGHLDHYH